MRAVSAALAPALSLSLALAACGAESGRARPAGEVAPAACPHEGDGACDEPWTCKVGTDEADCAAACASGALAPEHLACMTRARPPSVGGAPAEHGSRGSSGAIGTWDGTLAARGDAPGTTVDRYFRVHVPERYDPRAPTPVLYMLSGFTVDMYALDAYTELDRTADLNNFIVVYPAPLFRDFGRDIGWVYAWHVYTNEWSPREWQENPDLDFIRRLTARLKALYDVDRTRIFAAGHSRGAALALMLAFLAPDVIAGFGAQMGFAGVNDFDAFMRAYAGRRMPGVLVHGTDDADVPVESSDEIAKILAARGWTKGEHLLYLRLQKVVHQWQPQANEVLWQFLCARPLPIDQAAP